MPRRTTLVRSLLAAAALAMLCLVVVASAGSGLGQDDSHLRLPSLRAPLETAGMVAAALGLVIFVMALIYQKGTGARRQRGAGRWLPPLLLLLLALALRRGFVQPVRETSPTPTTRPPGSGEPATDEAPVETTSSSEVVWALAIISGGVLLAVVSARRLVPLPPPGERGERVLAAQMGDVLDDMIDGLRAEPDPRRAVIAAYARVEQSLGFHGLVRRASEAPLEYLTRALRHVAASSASIYRLTELFERAMFSTHEIDERMKHEAIDALIAVRDELRARSTIEAHDAEATT